MKRGTQCQKVRNLLYSKTGITLELYDIEKYKYQPEILPFSDKFQGRAPPSPSPLPFLDI